MSKVKNRIIKPNKVLKKKNEHLDFLIKKYRTALICYMELSDDLMFRKLYIRLRKITMEALMIKRAIRKARR